jgi:hypothetical protein
MGMNREFLDHLYSRCKQDPEKLGVVDHDLELFTRFIYNLSGQIVGYQAYNWRADKRPKNDVTGRYWTWLTKNDKKSTMIGAMGLEHIKWGEALYLVEGQFEQATAAAYGLNCVAVLTNNPKHLKNWVFSYPGEVVSLCQDDQAGRKLANLADRAVMLPKDLDEMTREEVRLSLSD